MTENRMHNDVPYFQQPVAVCPVCGGRGTVPQGFYGGWVNPVEHTIVENMGEVCRSCHGTGYLVLPYYAMPPMYMCCQHRGGENR